MNPTEYFRAGKLDLAIESLTEEVRREPLDTKRRTFLFELLCLAGQFERAEKQLDVLAQAGQQAEMGALVYQSALLAEKSRQEFFEKQEYSLHGPAREELSGELNDRAFQSISDADPRIGPRLEVFVGGRYVWIPFEYIETLIMEPPRRVRDLLWAPAIVRTSPDFQVRDLGEVLLPVLYPFSYRHSNDEVRLGRLTVWEQDADGAEIPFGQKLFVADGEEVPLLELRKLEIQAAQAAAG